MWANFGVRLAVDVAYDQGDYQPDGNVSAVIVSLGRGNQGSYQETTFGGQQLETARAASKETGAYFFNGNLDAYQCGTRFGETLAKYNFDPTRELVGIDCEDESETGTVAWGPEQVLNFVAGVQSVIPIEWSGVLVYMNYTVNHENDWSQVVAKGAHLWYARPDGPVDQAWWPVVTMKQDGLYNGVDADGYNQAFTALIGAAPKKRRGTNMFVFSVDDWGTGQVYIAEPGYVHYVAAPAELDAILAVVFNSLDASNITHVKAASVPAVLTALHLEEFTVDQIANLYKQSPATLVAGWREAGTVQLDDTQIAAIKASIPSTLTIDLNGKAVAA